MADFVYVTEIRPPRKEGGSHILLIQNGPKREPDPEKKNDFTNQLLVRVPSKMDLTGIEEGQYANIDMRPQGLSSQKEGGRQFLNVELVATSIKPAQPWQLGVKEHLHTKD